MSDEFAELRARVNDFTKARARLRAIQGELERQSWTPNQEEYSRFEDAKADCAKAYHAYQRSASVETVTRLLSAVRTG